MPYEQDMLLSFQNELLMNGFDIVIGKENIVENDTLSIDIDFSVKNGLTSFVNKRDNLNDLVDNISRVNFEVTVSSSTENSQFIELALSLDTQIIGISSMGFDSIEPLNGVFSRAANLIANFVSSSFSDKPMLDGNLWHDVLGSSAIEFHENQNGEGYGGYVKKQNIYAQNRFAIDELVFRINKTPLNNQSYNGDFKVSYVDGKAPDWFTADFIQYGNLLIIKPTSLNAPVGMSFFKK